MGSAFGYENREEAEMEAYTGFAEVYDELMDDVPYEEWAEFLCGLLEDYGVRDGQPDGDSGPPGL